MFTHLSVNAFCCSSCILFRQKQSHKDIPSQVCFTPAAQLLTIHPIGIAAGNGLFVQTSALVPELCRATTPGAVAATCVTITPYPNFSQRLTYKQEHPMNFNVCAFCPSIFFLFENKEKVVKSEESA